uniref:Uncharacterized protein n=1 Tax=Nymphaea colorata TaxID=210225 RepID=A0A5K0ZTR9_9MAGN
MWVAGSWCICQPWIILSVGNPSRFCFRLPFSFRRNWTLDWYTVWCYSTSNPTLSYNRIH